MVRYLFIILKKSQKRRKIILQKYVQQKFANYPVGYLKRYKNIETLNKIRLVICHPAVKAFSKKYGCNPDWQKLFAKYPKDMIWDTHIIVDKEYINYDYLGENESNY